MRPDGVSVDVADADGVHEGWGRGDRTPDGRSPRPRDGSASHVPVHDAGGGRRSGAGPVRAGADVARNADSEFLATRTFGERLADRIASFGGSWTFILLFFGVLIGWTVLNTEILARTDRAFDPYPYVFLNLMLSMLAALQAPVIMMSQRRQTVRDRVEAQTDYEVNLEAEIEIRALHEKLDTLREAQWAELVRMQQEQIQLLRRLLEAAPGAPPHR